MTGAGDLRERVAFARRESINPDDPDDYGNTVSEWVEQFRTRAQFVHLRGGEGVLAAKLENRHPLVVRVRASAQSREIGADWQVTDLTSGAVFNVRDITHLPARTWIDLLVEAGVAA